MTIYQRVLGEQFEALCPALRQFLGNERGGRASGLFRVTRKAGISRRLLTLPLRLPPDGEYELLLEVLPHPGGQRWVRQFGGYRLETAQRERRGLLVETTGVAALGFELSVRKGALFFRSRCAWLLGIPLPPWLVPRVEAENYPVECGGWQVAGPLPDAAGRGGGGVRRRGGPLGGSGPSCRVGQPTGGRSG